MTKRTFILLACLLTTRLCIIAQSVAFSGRVTGGESGVPLEYATVLLKESGLWAVTDNKGAFRIQNVPLGKATVVVRCMGYVSRTLEVTVKAGTEPLDVRLAEENLKLGEVEVVASRKRDEATTSYVVDRMALDNQQILNLGDVTSLLPGGKTVNGSLMSDNRMALRGNATGEKGNAAFGTAIEVDGVRLDNNAMMGETLSASTRNVGTSSIESVEIVTGIPSVEYGDLSNGIVKVNTRRGKSPLIIEGKVTQHTRQVSVNKGIDLGRHLGLLNVSLEHARSFSDAASPHTAYQRNVFSARYMNVFLQSTTPLTLHVGLTGNVGGYNSEADPDQELDDYDKVRDNAFSANFSLDWLLNRSWITNLSLSGSLSYADRRSESYEYTSSAATQAYLHTTEEGYHIAEDYDQNPNAAIIQGPTGYWYVRGFNDSRPLSYGLKLKGDWSRRFGSVHSKLLLGADFSGSKNYGRGTYYEDMRYAPTWREYRYDRLPALNTLALYAEETVTVPTGSRARLELTAGWRSDITFISGSDYGTVASGSPRLNGRYIFWRRRQAFVRDLSVHAGWGKSVKLPSFQVLYPQPGYSDKLVFTTTSSASNKSYAAYYTYPSAAQYNPSLKWQYAHQTDVGVEANLHGTRITVSAFYNKTFNPYTAMAVYTPYAYKYTAVSALNAVKIPSANRTYAIDPQTGVVTVSDATGALAPVTLAYTERKSYLANTRYVNASPISRYGLEWVVDFAQIKALRTSLRLDGNYYHYKGLDETLFADVPLGLSTTMSNGQPYQYIGYYVGSSATSTGYVASASVANGTLTRQVNLNATVTTHIPKVRMIVALRVESSLYRYSKPLSELSDGTRGYALESGTDYFGTPYDGTTKDQFIAVYPKYYSTWDDPSTLIPFAEKFEWARDNDKALYSDLAKLVVRSNYAYTMNPNRLSSYYSANLTVTKEIGDHVSVSFYANNFWNNMGKVKSSQTGLETSLFGSSYIPSYYYGLSLSLKL